MHITLNVFDKRIFDIIDPTEEISVIVKNISLSEGSIWDYANDRLIFNDIPVSNTMSWSKTYGTKLLFHNGKKANGQCFDPKGRMVVCEHATSRMSRCNTDGSNYEVIAETCDGIDLNSPNDVVSRSDGLIYFTDPDYGRQGNPAGVWGTTAGVYRPVPSDKRPVYILNPETGEIRVGADEFANPNGLCFSADEKLLYVNDSPNYCIRVYDVLENGDMVNGRFFAETPKLFADDTVPDGMKIDEDGNIFCCGPNGLHIYNKEGVELGILVTSLMDKALNFCWGGDDGRDLFITCVASVLKTRTKRRGITHLQYEQGIFPRRNVR